MDKLQVSNESDLSFEEIMDILEEILYSDDFSDYRPLDFNDEVFKD